MAPPNRLAKVSHAILVLHVVLHQKSLAMTLKVVVLTKHHILIHLERKFRVFPLKAKISVANFTNDFISMLASLPSFIFCLLAILSSLPLVLLSGFGRSWVKFAWPLCCIL